jgi:hypothetical protein
MEALPMSPNWRREVRVRARVSVSRLRLRLRLGVGVVGRLRVRVSVRGRSGEKINLMQILFIQLKIRKFRNYGRHWRGRNIWWCGGSTSSL